VLSIKGKDHLRKLVVNSVIILKVPAFETEREVMDWISPAHTRDGEFLVCWHLNDSAPWSD
jgi:hypothetical protein